MLWTFSTQSPQSFVYQTASEQALWAAVSLFILFFTFICISTGPHGVLGRACLPLAPLHQRSKASDDAGWGFLATSNETWHLLFTKSLCNQIFLSEYLSWYCFFFAHFPPWFALSIWWHTSSIPQCFVSLANSCFLCVLYVQGLNPILRVFCWFSSRCSPAFYERWTPHFVCSSHHA